MKMLNDTKELKRETVVVLGSFDGIHLGHKTLIDLAVKIGQEESLDTLLFTFENHPLSVINKERMPKLITSNRVKCNLIKKMGIDFLALEKFDKVFMRLSPEEFIKTLHDNYKCRHIVVGYNYRFGYKNLGDVELLQKNGEKYGYTVHMVQPVKLNEVAVSSTFIRGLILEGEITTANKFLGHSFVMDGMVIRGKQIGRTIGFPTLNLDYDLKSIVPKGGVYFTMVEYKGAMYKGITNVGYNPTVNGNKLSIETHVLNFDEVIYDQYFKLHFIRKIREEKKFNSLEELKVQIEKDKNVVKREVTHCKLL